MTDYTKLAKQLDAVNDAHGSQAVRDAAAILRQLSAIDVAGVMALAMKWVSYPFSTKNRVALEAAIRALAVRGGDSYVIALLVAAGHVTQEKVDQAREIAAATPQPKETP